MLLEVQHELVRFTGQEFYVTVHQGVHMRRFVQKPEEEGIGTLFPAQIAASGDTQTQVLVSPDLDRHGAPRRERRNVAAAAAEGGDRVHLNPIRRRLALDGRAPEEGDAPVVGDRPARPPAPEDNRGRAAANGGRGGRGGRVPLAAARGGGDRHPVAPRNGHVQRQQQCNAAEMRRRVLAADAQRRAAEAARAEEQRRAAEEAQDEDDLFGDGGDDPLNADNDPPDDERAEVEVEDASSGDD